jgi:hypothetical protein
MRLESDIRLPEAGERLDKLIGSLVSLAENEFMAELKLNLRGPIPANLMPFKDDFSMDEAQYRRHLRWLADVPGVGAIVCNGHAAEVASLTEDEQRRAIAIAGHEVGGKVKLVAGTRLLS